MTDELIDVDLDAEGKTAEGAGKEKPAAGKKDAVPEVEVIETKPGKIIDPDEGIETLKAKLAAEKTARETSEQARIAAEQRANAMAAEAVQAKTEVQGSNLQLVNSAIERVKQSDEALKIRYREARASGDVDAEVEIQRQIATNAAQLVTLEAGKKQLEAQPKPTVAKPSDPVERFIADAQMSPRSADWVRRHPEYVRDPRLHQKMIGAHNIAVADGYAADTDAYFQAIEETLKVNRADPALQQQDDPTTAAAQVTQRRSSPPAAPVSRSGTGDGKRSNVVRLSREEIEIAELNGMTPAEYARQKQKIELEKRGGVQ